MLCSNGFQTSNLSNLRFIKTQGDKKVTLSKTDTKITGEVQQNQTKVKISSVPVFETEEEFCPLFSSLKRKRPPYDKNEQGSNELHSLFKKSTPHLHRSSTKYKLTRPRVERFQYLSNTVYNFCGQCWKGIAYIHIFRNHLQQYEPTAQSPENLISINRQISSKSRYSLCQYYIIAMEQTWHANTKKNN